MEPFTAKKSLVKLIERLNDWAKLVKDKAYKEKLINKIKQLEALPNCDLRQIEKITAGLYSDVYRYCDSCGYQCAEFVSFDIITEDDDSKELERTVVVCYDCLNKGIEKIDNLKGSGE